ncbi:MAG: hypothetical protein MZU97_02365 [Bacillus subtilis]|nr:hypothetical protein [Bacillus subtilis]
MPPTLFLGEHSSVTPGADIDAAGILHHVRLIKYSDFDLDSDNDGLIDILEEIIGTNKMNPDTRRRWNSDGLEYSGWHGTIASPKALWQEGSTQAQFTNPLVNDVDRRMGIINLN